MPTSVEEYVHQVGRAGRLNKIGFAISFINNSNKKLFLELKELFDITGTSLPAELTNSPHLLRQQEQRRMGERLNCRDIDRKRGWNENEVNPQSLMGLLSEHKKKKTR